MRFNERLLQGYDIGKKISEFHGHTRLDLLRDGKVVHRVEKSNTITGWIGDALSAGNFFNQISANKIYPLSQWFGGCLLTEGTNDATTSYIASNADITAQAGDGGYSGSNSKIGTFNALESGSGIDANGKCYIRNVWDWGTSSGNGIIDSVCLTRGSLGYTEMNESTALADDKPAFEELSSTFTISEDLRKCQVIDYDGQKAFNIDYSSGTITIIEYELINSKVIHLYGNLLDVIESGTAHTISQTLQSFSYQAYSIHYDASNGIISLFGVNGSDLYQYDIDISTWTVTATTHTYSGANFTQGIGYEDYLRTDKFPVVGNYIYCFSDSAAKISCCDLTSSSITQENNPLYDIYGGSTIDRNWISGVSVIYPNGDWLKIDGRSTTYALYFHNGKYYAVKGLTGSLNRYALVLTTGGTILSVVNASNASQLFAPFGAIATVNNITQVEKQASLTMKLTYTITET